MWYVPNSAPRKRPRDSGEQRDLGIFPGARPPCSYDCWENGLFGDEVCCSAEDSWGSVQIPVKPGKMECLYPDKRDTSPPTFVGTMLGLCAALEGGVIVGGPDDNTQLVGVLTGSDVKKE